MRLLLVILVFIEAVTLIYVIDRREPFSFLAAAGITLGSALVVSAFLVSLGVYLHD